MWRVLSSRFPDGAAAQTGEEEREPEDTDRKPSMRRPKTIMQGNALRQPAPTRDLINNGQTVPSGMVPASTRLITYDLSPSPRDPLPVAFGLGPIAPNPVTLDATIGFALPSDDPATLEIVDLAGQRVFHADVASRGAGRHAIRIGELKRLASGIYLVRISQGRESLIQRLVVVR